MDRLNHVKIVSPDPEAVDRFLCEVLEIPKGWPLASMGEPAAAPAAARPERPLSPLGGQVSFERVTAYRGDDGTGGCITGSTESRQFQILRGERPHIWSVAIGTRHLERARERCLERGIPCSELNLVPWGAGSIRVFFAEVGGIVFEVMRVEAAPA